ncbi:MAG: ATP-binding cassette domain-containing protein [Thermoplasmata archaeon]
MSGNVIAVSGLTKHFGELKAVDRVSFEVKEGEIFGFLGPNGAGKTTTINMLTTVLRPTAGGAKVAGHDITHDPLGVCKSIGLVPQEYPLREPRPLPDKHDARLAEGLRPGEPRDLRDRRSEAADPVQPELDLRDERFPIPGGLRHRIRGDWHRPVLAVPEQVGARGITMESPEEG